MSVDLLVFVFLIALAGVSVVLSIVNFPIARMLIDRYFHRAPLVSLAGVSVVLSFIIASVGMQSAIIFLALIQTEPAAAFFGIFPFVLSFGLAFVNFRLGFHIIYACFEESLLLKMIGVLVMITTVVFSTSVFFFFFS